MKNTSEILIIGAGIAGCASAYYLAKSGANVLVIDKDSIGTHASKYALGLLNPLTGSEIPGKNQEMMEEAFIMHKELWPTLLDESGIDFQPSIIQHIELFMTQKEADTHSEEMSRWEKAEGFKSHRMSREEILNLEPRLSPEVHSGQFLQGIGIVDSGKLTLAFAEAAKSYGAKFLNMTAVALNSSGSKGYSLVTDKETLSFDKLVIASGPWSGMASTWLNYSVPITPLKGEIIYFDATNNPHNIHLELRASDFHGACTVITKGDGYTWLAATENPSGLDETTTQAAREFLLSTGQIILPGLSEAKIVNQTACLRPIAPDLRPILGIAPEWDNIYLATGAGKKGILISPVIGKATSDLILQGSSTLPIKWANPNRFTDAVVS